MPMTGRDNGDVDDGDDNKNNNTEPPPFHAAFIPVDFRQPQLRHPHSHTVSVAIPESRDRDTQTVGQSVLVLHRQAARMHHPSTCTWGMRDTLACRVPAGRGRKNEVGERQWLSNSGWTADRPAGLQ